MAIIDCSKINAAFSGQYDCTKSPVAGTAYRLICINYADIDRSSIVETAGVVSAISLLGTAVGYEFESLPDASVGEYSLATGTYINQFDHAVTSRVFVKNQAAKTFLNNLKNARLVVIVENKSFKPGDATPVKYEIYGLDSGLVCTENAGTTEYQDQTVGTFKLASSDKSKEGSLPKTLFITSIDATTTLVNGLLN